jgi:hypothetical protein
MEILILTVLVVSFATLVTVHVSLAFGLFTRDPRWHGLVALVAPPLALYLGWKERRKGRVFFWVASLAVYAAARVAAAR